METDDMAVSISVTFLALIVYFWIFQERAEGNLLNFFILGIAVTLDIYRKCGNLSEHVKVYLQTKWHSYAQSTFQNARKDSSKNRCAA